MWVIHTPAELATGLHHLPTGIVYGSTGMVTGPDQGKLVRDLGMLWQDLGNLDLGRRGLDRFKRSPHLGRCIGLHVKSIDMTGCTEIENHDAGAIIVLVLDRPVGLGCHVLG